MAVLAYDSLDRSITSISPLLLLNIFWRKLTWSKFSTSTAMFCVFQSHSSTKMAVLTSDWLRHLNFDFSTAVAKRILTIWIILNRKEPIKGMTFYYIYTDCTSWKNPQQKWKLLPFQSMHDSKDDLLVQIIFLRFPWDIIMHWPSIQA